jgi:hypothetical protein
MIVVCFKLFVNIFNLRKKKEKKKKEQNSYYFLVLRPWNLLCFILFLMKDIHEPLSHEHQLKWTGEDLSRSWGCRTSES